MKKVVFATIFILILATSWVKNSTKTIEDTIFDVNEKIRSLKAEIEYALLEYTYLSSPKNLTQYQIQYFEKDLIPLDITKIRELSKKNIGLKEKNFKNNE